MFWQCSLYRQESVGVWKNAPGALPRCSLSADARDLDFALQHTSGVKIGASRKTRVWRSDRALNQAVVDQLEGASWITAESNDDLAELGRVQPAFAPLILRDP
jgi:hypothetical protein